MQINLQVNITNSIIKDDKLLIKNYRIIIDDSFDLSLFVLDYLKSLKVVECLSDNDYIIVNLQSPDVLYSPITLIYKKDGNSLREVNACQFC